MMTNVGNLVTQGQFSFLPPLTDKQISAQIKYALKNNWAIGIEYTDDPHPRNTYWEMFGNPMFDLKDPAGILGEINDCVKPIRSLLRRRHSTPLVGESPTCSTSSTVPNRTGLAWYVGNGRSCIRYTIHSYAPTNGSRAVLIQDLPYPLTE